MLRGLAHYRLLKALAVGSQAHVYLALDTLRNRQVCIKIYHLQGDRALRHRLEEEAWKLARIDHRRVVEVLDVVAHGPELALVTSYIPGCDLGQLLAVQQRLSAPASLSIASDLAVALTALRQAQIVHGDLSARNVLMDRAGRATLGDFGVSVMRGEELVGFSLDSLAPEQCAGGAGDLRSDFFALGLLLYRCLTGRHPFLRDGLLDRSALAGGLKMPPLLADLEPEAAHGVGQLLMSLLAADPQERPARPFELRHRLTEIQQLLPPATALPRQVAAAAAQQAPVDVPLALPSSLVKLAFPRRVTAALRQLWSHSSLAVRALTVFLATAPALVLVLWWSSPTACIAVASPRLRVDPAAGEPFPPVSELHGQLTSMLKAMVPHAWVLGAGDDSDSQPVLGSYGPRDRCVAERELKTHVACHRALCTIEMLSHTPDGVYRSQLSLPVDAGRLRMDDALRQLIGERLDALHP